MHRFLAVLHARNLEFLRDRAALSWNVLLPVFLVLGFAFLFSGQDKNLYKVGVYGSDVEPTQLAAESETTFFATNHIQFIVVTDLSKAIVNVQHHQLDMLVDMSSGPRYWINSSSAKGYVLERVLWGTSRGTDQGPFIKETVSGREVRYVDWVMPGILAMKASLEVLAGLGGAAVAVRLAAIGARIIERLRGEGFEVAGPGPGPGQSAIVSCRRPGADMEGAAKTLAAEGIAVSLRRDRAGTAYVRLSPHCYITDAEVDHVLDRLAAACAARH